MRGLLLFLTACGASEAPPISVPNFGTSHVVLGTAAAGRPLSPGALRVTTPGGELRPDAIAGVDVDMMVAGLDALDLPAGTDPVALRFLNLSEEKARRLPPLRNPYVLAAPGPADAPHALVPVEDPNVSRDLRMDRLLRYEAMTDDLGIEEACTEGPITVTVPRIPADGVFAMRTLSSGETFVGFASTSTTFFGVFGLGSQQLELIPIRTSTEGAVVPGEKVEVEDLGDREITLDGRRFPAGFTLDFESGFGSLGHYLEWSPRTRRYEQKTPALVDGAPRTLKGARHVRINDQEQLCLFGGVLGADRRGGVWCSNNSTEWTLYDFGRSFTVTELWQQGPRLYAFDLAGNVTEYTGTRWRPLSQSALNEGCEPLCVGFGASAVGAVGVLGGSRSQLLVARPINDVLQIQTPPILDAALYGDERADAEDPLRFTAATVDPSGAVWLGTYSGQLFSIAPDGGRLTRICIPKAMRGVPISALEAHPDGRLIIGMVPALFGFTRWQR